MGVEGVGPSRGGGYDDQYYNQLPDTLLQDFRDNDVQARFSQAVDLPDDMHESNAFIKQFTERAIHAAKEYLKAHPHDPRAKNIIKMAKEFQETWKEFKSSKQGIPEKNSVQTSLDNLMNAVNTWNWPANAITPSYVDPNFPQQK